MSQHDNGLSEDTRNEETTQPIQKQTAQEDLPRSPSSEYEPNDSRNVTGAANTPDGRWSGDEPAGQGSGEYEPRDSRKVTGTAKTENGRWTNDAKKKAPGDN